jgi:hypothetical protein
MNSIIELSVKQLRQVINLREKIETLEEKLNQLAGSTAEPVAAKAPKKKRKMSAAGKARIVAALKARWAKYKAAKQAAKPVKKKFTMSAAAKAKISAAAKARWAKWKAAKK